MVSWRTVDKAFLLFLHNEPPKYGRVKGILFRDLFFILLYQRGKSWRLILLLLKSCNRCGKLIPYGVVYCSECGPIVEKQREERIREQRKESNRRYNKTRDPKYGRFYNSSEWRTLSRKKLQDDGYKCVKCGKIASEVDHIEPIQTPGGWVRRLDIDNLQSLCLECHNEKHERFKRRLDYMRGNNK